MRRKVLEPIALPELPPLGTDAAALPEPAQPAAEPDRPMEPRVQESGPSEAPAPHQDLDIRAEAMWRRTADIARLLAGVGVDVRELTGGAVYPLAAYDRFRRDHQLRPPPLPVPDGQGVEVVVDATRSAPFLLRETLQSLRNQSHTAWHATVVGGPAIRAHPVASFANVDTRISFVDEQAFELRGAEWSLWLSAGTVLDPVGLHWLLFAGARCDAELVFADHDHGVSEVEEGQLRADPWLYGALDKAMIDMVPAPAAVLARRDLAARTPIRFDGGEGSQRALIAAATGRAPHVPRLLATRLELPLTARAGRETSADAVAGRLAPAATPVRAALPPPRDERIAVVIPNRDAADLLARAVSTLRGKARLASRLDIVIVDNRTTDPAALELLGQLEGSGAARRHVFDQPFNWGLASNEGARASDAPVVIFANNDMEMLSTGWDDILLAALASPGVGAVGARLLYPHATVQHAGVVFGMNTNEGQHEGRHVAASEPGPNRRLVVPRSVAAVTGAFLGVTRDNFEAVGGIDTGMQVAHSDLDFCFNLRERGLTIRYEPGIELIHYESVTRGVNATKADIAFDESERAELIRRWGNTLNEDVGVSPYWARRGIGFDLLREPSMVEIVRHIDKTGRDHPWLPLRREAQEMAAWRPEALG